jgi:hypothetical protein
MERRISLVPTLFAMVVISRDRVFYFRPKMGCPTGPKMHLLKNHASIVFH